MMNVRHNKRGVKIHETEWGEPQDCVAIAKWSERDVIILHTETDRCTIIPYTANEIETKSVAKLLALDWAREPSRGKHGIYLIHDGIHYNAIRLRDDQEEDEQNKESNCTECTNKKQQRRTKEPAALATPNMQDNSSEEDMREEGDKMRATNAPCGRVCGSRTQDKTNEKGKQIHDEIHYNALSLRDNQEEGEQDEESSIGEYTNQTQQKRTTEHATPTQGIQNNPLSENTREEEDDMRATGQNKRKRKTNPR